MIVICPHCHNELQVSVTPVFQPPSRPPAWHPGWVYFMASRGLIKIGFSRSPQERAKQLAYKGFKPIEIVGVMLSRCGLERELHFRFAHLRVQGEWFTPSDELRDFIASSAVKP